MNFDDALDAILSLETLWRERRGHVCLEDIGVGPYRIVRIRGYLALPPERWRRYPGARAIQQSRLVDGQ